MGRKGAKLTEHATQTCEQFVESLADLGDISHKKMFGGYGVFEGGVMFALVTSDGDIYLKVADANRERFNAAGCEKYGRMPYHALPQEILEDNKALHEWAATSIEVGHDAEEK